MRACAPAGVRIYLSLICQIVTKYEHTSCVLTGKDTMRDGGMATQNAPAKWHFLMADEFQKPSEPSAFAFSAPASQRSCNVFSNSGTSHWPLAYVEPAWKYCYLVQHRKLLSKRTVPQYKLHEQVWPFTINLACRQAWSK